MNIQLRHTFEDIISLDNLLLAWDEFIVDKKKKPDVQQFERNLMDNLIMLHEELSIGIYTHSGYKEFIITDPKHRLIHKASVRDRVLNHAVYRILYPHFSRTFMADSYSCQVGKGTHRALNRFRDFARRASHNNTETIWVLKGDIRKFFASIDQEILLDLLVKYIPESPLTLRQAQGDNGGAILDLLRTIVKSFQLQPGKGLPLGNLTSQLFVNVYMNKFDQFVKHWLKAKCYIRYADDFVIISPDRNQLDAYVPLLESFLYDSLKLSLHPKKLSIQTLASGVDFLGWIHFPHHRILRATTERRMMRRIAEHPTEGTLHSYLGLLGHGDGFRLSQTVRNEYGLWRDSF